MSYVLLFRTISKHILNIATKNLARDRAAHFGQGSIASHSAVLQEDSEVVVTTTAADIVAPDHGVITADDENELRSKPRGFFADQFEVQNPPIPVAMLSYLSTEP